MLVNFSHRHCSVDNPVKKAVPNTIIKDSYQWIAICWGFDHWLWIGIIHKGFQYYGAELNSYYTAHQHPPKTVVSMVQE